MPQNAWKLLFEFKRISLKRCIMFKQSFYLLAHWMRKSGIYSSFPQEVDQRRLKALWTAEICNLHGGAEMEKIQWLILGILCILFILCYGMFMPSRPKWSIDAIDRKVWPHGGGFLNYIILYILFFKNHWL